MLEQMVTKKQLTSWTRRMQLFAGLVYVGMLITMPWSWWYLGLGISLLGLALVMPGETYFAALEGERKKKALTKSK